MNHRVFVGIDQTGAALKGGRAARPLPVAALVFDEHRQSWSFLQGKNHPSRLPEFTVDALLDWGGSLVARAWDEGRVVVLVDAVIGLPVETWTALGIKNVRELLHLARQSGGDFPYGRKPAEAFFQKLLESTGWTPQEKLPIRLPEKWAKANSVFTTRPYQKNIQTGTYRIWVDLARDLRWEKDAQIFPQEFRSIGTNAGKNWIMEGYPSLIWKTVLGCSQRSPALLLERISGKLSGLDCELSLGNLWARDSDWADAVTLAFAGGYYFGRREWMPEKLAGSPEGWILGLDPQYINI